MFFFIGGEFYSDFQAIYSLDYHCSPSSVYIVLLQ